MKQDQFLEVIDWDEARPVLLRATESARDASGTQGSWLSRGKR
jgi:hypothetical protein